MLIYKIENKINHKIYIGQTTTSLKERIRGHKKCLKKNNSYLYFAINKYGWDNFEFQIIDENCKTQDVLNKKEILWIAIYDSANRKYGYNIEKGGNGKGKVSKETRHKLSEIQKGKRYSVETKAKMSKNQKGTHAGEDHGNAKLTWIVVNDIREKYKTGNFYQKDLAKIYNIVRQTVSKIINYKLWIPGNIKKE